MPKNPQIAKMQLMTKSVLVGLVLTTHLAMLNYVFLIMQDEIRSQAKKGVLSNLVGLWDRGHPFSVQQEQEPGLHCWH